MLFFSPIFALAASVFVRGAPIRRAATSADILVLQFAGLLEQLEAAFYTQALDKFQVSDFIAAGFADPQMPIQQFLGIQFDEETHLSTINSTLESLGASPISGCQFDFSSALTDVSTMAATARVVENLGVAAYLGATALIEDAIILVAAATILTVEARHQTVLNLLNDGTSIPQAFDIALTPSEVLAIAGPFISGCEIGIPANPSLTVTNTGRPTSGTTLSFASSALNSTTNTTNFSCQMIVGGLPASLSFPYDDCTVPEGINGPVALYITSDDQPINNDVTQENTNTVVAGPTMVFIDTEADLLAELAVSGTASSSGSSSGSLGSTATASSVLSSATSVASASSPSVASSASLASSSGLISSVPVASSSSVAPTASLASSSGVISSASLASSTLAAPSASITSSAAASVSVDDSGAIATGTITTTISPSQATSIISAASLASASSGASTASGTAAVAALSSASAASSAAAPAAAPSVSAAVGSSTSDIAVPGGPNMYVGPAAGGAINVLGWS